jgi:hypothetical protein
MTDNTYFLQLAIGIADHAATHPNTVPEAVLDSVHVICKDIKAIKFLTNCQLDELEDWAKQIGVEAE